MNIQDAKQKIQRVLDADRDTSRGLVKEAILPVSVKEAEELSRVTGLDITTEYRRVVDKSGFNHAFNEHGHDSEKLRGQRRLTAADILRIPEIITGYDAVKAPLSSTGKPLKSALGNAIVQYEKTFDDGTTYYVEEARTGRKELAFATMWVKEKGKA